MTNRQRDGSETNATAGRIRLTNEDVIDLYGRARIRAKVIVN
jgi:lipoprotein-anchoring transpeptidase ErfK/SrfK